MAMTTTGENTVDTSLNGRTALITGASKGLGLAMAKAFYCHGAKVVLLARGAADLAAAEAEIQALAVADEYRGDADVAAFVCDVTDAKAIVATHQQAVDRFGAIDILVNNAGQSAAKPFLNITDEEWQADLDLKLMAAVRLTRLVWPAMAERQMGTDHQSAECVRKTARCGHSANVYFSGRRHGADQGAQRRGGGGQHIGERHADWFYRERSNPSPARGKRRVTVS